MLIMLALMTAVLGFAGVYTIGTGATGSYTAPYNGLWDNNWSKVIYTKTEINAAGLTAANSITGIAFNVTNTPSNYTMLDQRVYVRHTSAALYEATDIDHPNSALFDAVYQGDLTYNGSGWFTIAFSTPFAWNGTDNIEFLFENHDGGWTSGYPNFAYTSTSPNYLTAYKAQDSSFPQGVNGERSYNRPNIQLYTPMVDPPNPTVAISPANGASFVNAAATLNWTSLIDATGYKLYFGNTNPPAYIGDLGNVTTYNPNGLADGSTYYWQVVPYNAYGDATGCPIWSFTTTPAGVVMIGDGTANQYMPVNIFYGYSYAQSIYRQEDINVANQRIEKIAYYWNGVGAAPNSNEWVVYMGHTDNETFGSTTEWIPLSGLTQVYSGTLNIPATAGWITINLSNPFVYNNTQNLVIAVDENKSSYDSSSYFFFNTLTTGENRSLRCQSDGTNPDPTSPPAGTLTAAYPNIMMEFGALPANPIFNYAPTALNFGTMLQNTPSDWKIVTVTNTGGGTINISASNVSILGTNATMFEFDAANLPAALGAGQSVNIPVRATATDEGDLSATLRIVYNANNYDVALSASGLPAGTVFIGEGTATQRQPFGHYWGYERSAGLYTPEQVGSVGLIDNVGWYCATTSAASVPYKIYIGSTAETAFTAQTWDDFISGLTLAKEGTHLFSDLGWHSFPLTTPVVYGGGNLIVAVETNYGGSGAGSYAYFRYTTSTTGSHMNWYGDNDPPTTNGSLNAQLPNLMLHLGEPPTGVPATPILGYPADTAINLPVQGFNLTWMADLVNGGLPTYYAVFMSQDEESIFDDYYFEVSGTSFNPVTDSEGEIEFAYEDRWYWTVLAGNVDGESDPATIRSFVIEADPAITSFPWCEGFEGSTFPPAGWTMVDADGDGNNWFRYSAENSAHTGNYSAGTASWTSATGALTPDNWLITPPLAIPATGDYMVEYYVAGQDPAYPDEHYGFYVSTSGPSIANFTLLREETMEDAEWHQRSNPLASYAGQTVHFAFRHFNSTDVFYMKIDDVCVREIPQAPMLSITPTEFDFGTTHVLSPTTPKTFTLSNLGIGNINIGEGDIWLTGDVEGNFVINAQNLPVAITASEPYSFTVQFIAQSAGLKSATLNIQDNITRAVHTVALTGEAVEEPIASVILLEGELSGADAAYIDWASIYGDPTQSGYLHWDDSIDRGAVGAGANQYHVAVMFGPEVMEHNVDQVLDGVMIHINEEPQTVDYLKVWSGTGADIAPETLLVTQAVSGLTVGWNYIPLTTPIATTDIDALWVGYHVNGIEETFPASTDGLGAVDGRGNLVELGGDWMTLVDANIAGNWLIHAHFTDEAKYLTSRRTPTLTPKTTHAQVKSQKDMRDLPLAAIQTVEMNRVLRGFNIFRDNVQINAATVAAYYYTDENLAPGTYYYSVQSVHDSANGPISYAVPVTIPEPPAPFALPFTEDWSAGMEENWWTAGGTNWNIDSSTGNPAPSARFYWSPRVYDYNIPLTSYSFDASELSNVHLSFDLYLSNYSTSAENVMAWEVWDGNVWNRIDERSYLDGSISWTTLSYNISEYAANSVFKIRFVAYGEDCYQINYWNIDNINLYSLPEILDPVTDLSVSKSGSDFILDWTAVEGAQWYAIYISDDPYTGFTFAYVVESAGDLTIPASLLGSDKLFVRITAGTGDTPPLPAKRN